MKTKLVVFALVTSHWCAAQTNTFPSSGNVGIGTTSPAVPLHLKTGGTSAWIALDKPSATEGGLQFMKAGATLFYLYSDDVDNDALKIQATNQSGEADATPRIHIPYSNKNLYMLESGGMLGVGLNNPSQRMDVLGRVKVRSNAAVSAGMWLTDINGTENSFIGNHDLTASSPLGLYSGGAWRLICDQTGRVGIGTISPQVNLEVVGFGQIIRNTSAGSYTSLRLYNNTNNMMRSLEIDYSGSSYSGPLVAGGPAGESGSITTVGAYPLTLGTANTMRMTIREDGNVGIGTTTPDAKLSVKGQIHAQEMKVDLNGAVAPDYVFDKDYKLPALGEIQSYITANKYLPEVPSAKEMEEKGINVGEMNLLLLKKVEELTLYVIELKGEIDKLKQIQK